MSEAMITARAPVDRVEGVELLGPVAVVPVDGPIGPWHAEDRRWGVTPTAWLQRAILACVDDDRVEGVVLTIDSPGGNAAGFACVIEAIDELRAVKPIVAYATGSCLSAGYWLASRAHAVWADSGWTQVGMIGGYIELCDDSQRYAKEGMVLRYATDTPRKVETHPGVPIDDDTVAHFTEVLAPNVAAFRAGVADGRGITIDPSVAPGDGRVYSASRGIELGLVDEIVPAAQLLERAARLFDQAADAAPPQGHDQ